MKFIVLNILQCASLNLIKQDYLCPLCNETRTQSHVVMTAALRILHPFGAGPQKWPLHIPKVQYTHKP